ncbi:hypothetical protein AAIG33_01220 [Phytobacter ursingii]|uniref:hypothetical protein n=1 Tax=Phytobacter ursingii TaxID=1972431 RepID=UPI0031B7DF13
MMKSIEPLTDSELDEIISGSVDGVYPTSQEVSMATELKTYRDILATEEPDYIRYSCGCCGYESLSPVSVCPTCNFDNIEETPLFMHSAPSIPVVPDEKYWYLISWFGAGQIGSSEIWLDTPWQVGSEQNERDRIADANNMKGSDIVILSVFPMYSAAPKGVSSLPNHAYSHAGEGHEKPSA